MDDNLIFKLWVIKFCLKIIYPKYNFFVFLVYLAIKYRIIIERGYQKNKIMDFLKIQTISNNVQKFLLMDPIGDNLYVYLNKCLIISKNKYIELAVENFFYLDNGMLWVAVKLRPEVKEKCKKVDSSRDNDKFKYSFNFVTSEIHKKLWSDNNMNCLDKVRIVPVVGSKLVHDDTAFTSENEYFNIISMFGLNMNEKNLEISFHPVPTVECAPSIAAFAEVNLLVNDFDLPNDFIKEVLRNYFELPKLMSANDCFSVELTPEVTEKYYYKYLDLVQTVGTLYFKCKRLGSDMPSESSDIKDNNTKCDYNIVKPYFIIKNVTQLTLGENIHSLKPKDMYFKYDKSLKSNNTMVQSCPYGLRKIFNQMQETLSPFLQGSLSKY